MISKFLAGVTAIVATVLTFSAVASAHVTVSPKQIVAAERVTFTVSVPNEKDVDVTGLRLEIPGGLSGATPTVHPGWTIDVDKEGETVKSISWNGGVIPAGQRDDFTFRAQAPTDEGELAWRAYQTYADGTTVAWDQDPAKEGGEAEGGDTGPYSVTKVSTEASLTTAASSDDKASTTNATSTIALGVSLVALVLSVFGLLRKSTK